MLAVILIIVAVILVVYSTASNLKVSKDGESQNQGINQNTQAKGNITEVAPEHITFLLNEMKAYKLHNPPLSKNTPKIKTIIDSSVFSSEVKKGKITTTNSDTNEPDIIIKTDKQTFLDIVNVDNPITAIQQEVNKGHMQIELVAGKTELFTKGYLSLYKEITGKNS